MTQHLTLEQERVVTEGSGYVSKIERILVQRSLANRMLNQPDRFEHQVSSVGLESTSYLLACRIWWLLPILYAIVTIGIPHLSLAFKGEFNWYSYVAFILLSVPGFIRWGDAMRARSRHKGRGLT